MFKRIITYSILTFVTLFGFFGNINLDIVQNNGDIHGVTLSYEGNITYADCTTDPNSIPCIGATKTGADAAKKPESTDATKALNSVVEALNILLGFITLIISPAILFAGWLMSPDWTSGDLFGLRAPMHALWVTVSNIVYFVYAILLILIALGTMFGKDTFSYKVMLPKLALGIIMVPFTWWFVQWTISISSVVTASVVTIPLETISTTNSSDWMSRPSIPKNIVIDESNKDSKPNIEECIGTRGPNYGLDTGKCIAPIIFLRDQSGMYGHMMVYAYSIFKFKEVKELSGTIDTLKTITGIIHQGLVGILMFLVFGLLTLALVVMLLVRAIKLWVYAIFSPLFTFRFVAGSNILGGDDDTFSIKEFIGLCFVPAIVGLTLSFGLIMVNAVSSSSGEARGKEGTCKKEQIEDKGCALLSIMGSPDNKITRIVKKEGSNSGTTTNIFTWGGVTIDFIGKAGASKSPELEAEDLNKTIGVLDSAGGVFGTIIVDIIALMFIWLSFMAAKNISKALKVAAQPFEDIGNKVGSLAKSIPKYTPIPGTGMSANSMGKIPQTLEHSLSSADNARFEKSGIGKLLQADMNIPEHEAKKLTEAIKNGAGTPQDTEIIKKIMKEYGNRTNAYNSGAPEAMMELLKDENKRKQFYNNPNISENSKDAFKKFYANNPNGIHTDQSKKELLGIMLTAFGNTKSTTDSGINLNINPSGNEKDIASAIRGSNTEKTITRSDLEAALKEKIKKPDGNIDTDKIKKILDEIKDDFFKKPGTSSGGGGGH